MLDPIDVVQDGAVLTRLERALEHLLLPPINRSMDSRGAAPRRSGR